MVRWRSSSVSWSNNPPSLLIIVLCFCILVHEQLAVLLHQLPQLDKALDISTSATLLVTSFTHNSGKTFRSWVSVGLTGVVNAFPARENADQCVDHCSFGGSATIRSQTYTLFSCRNNVRSLEVRHDFSTAILIKNKLVSVLHHLAY